VGSGEGGEGVGGASMNSSLDFLIGKNVLADLGAYQFSGRLLSCRGDDLTLQTRGGSRILINRLEMRSVRELVARRRKA